MLCQLRPENALALDPVCWAVTNRSTLLLMLITSLISIINNNTYSKNDTYFMPWWKSSFSFTLCCSSGRAVRGEVSCSGTPRHIAGART